MSPSTITDPPPQVYTLAEGRPVHDPTTSTILSGTTQRGGGLALLQDTQLIETLAHFPRERIPERYVALSLRKKLSKAYQQLFHFIKFNES
jgi:catalase